MADWTYTPKAPYRIRRIGQPELVSSFEDGTELRRQKNTTERRVFQAVYRLAETDADAATDFYEARGMHTTFTIVAYDPKGTPGTTEATVRFNRPLEVNIISPGLNLFEVRAEFIEVI